MKTKYSNWRQELNEAEALPPATPPKKPQYGLTRQQTAASTPASAATPTPTRTPAASPSWLDKTLKSFKEIPGKVQRFVTQPTRSGSFQQQPVGGVVQLSDPNTPATRLPSSTSRSQQTAERSWRPGQGVPSQRQQQPPTTPPPTTPPTTRTPRQPIIRKREAVPFGPLGMAVADVASSGFTDPKAYAQAAGGLIAATGGKTLQSVLGKKLPGLGRSIPGLKRTYGVGQQATNQVLYIWVKQQSKI